MCKVSEYHSNDQQNYICVVQILLLTTVQGLYRPEHASIPGEPVIVCKDYYVTNPPGNDAQSTDHHQNNRQNNENKEPTCTCSERN